MKQTFNVIYTYNVTLYEDDKVRQLLDYINFPNNDLKTDVTICRSIHSASFYTAFAYLSTVISLLLPSTQPSSGKYVRIRKSNSSGRVGRGDRRGQFEDRRGRGRGGCRGRGGRGKGNINQSENGVNISNPTMWYGKE